MAPLTEKKTVERLLVNAELVETPNKPQSSGDIIDAEIVKPEVDESVRYASIQETDSPDKVLPGAEDLKKDLDKLGDKLDNEEIDLDEYKKESDETLVKHTFRDLSNIYNSTYEQSKNLANTTENIDPMIRESAKTILNTFTFDSLCEIYKTKNLVQWRDDDAHFKEVYASLDKLLRRSKTSFPAIRTFKILEHINKDLTKKIFRHFVLAVYEYIKVESWKSSVKFVHQLMMNVQFCGIVLRVAEPEDGIPMDAYKAMSDGINKFNQCVLDEIISEQMEK